MPPAEVRPQTFDSFQSPDSASPAVRLEKSKLTLRSEPAASQAAKERRPREWLKDFTLSSTPESNPFFSCRGTERRSLVFAPASKLYSNCNL